jgi:hypothetical protein
VFSGVLGNSAVKSFRGVVEAAAGPVAVQKSTFRAKIEMEDFSKKGFCDKTSGTVGRVPT